MRVANFDIIDRYTQIMYIMCIRKGRAKVYELIVIVVRHLFAHPMHSFQEHPEMVWIHTGRDALSQIANKCTLAPKAARRSLKHTTNAVLDLSLIHI